MNTAFHSNPNFDSWGFELVFPPACVVSGPKLPSLCLWFGPVHLASPAPLKSLVIAAVRSSEGGARQNRLPISLPLSKGKKKNNEQATQSRAHGEKTAVV